MTNRTYAAILFVLFALAGCTQPDAATDDESSTDPAESPSDPSNGPDPTEDEGAEESRRYGERSFGWTSTGMDTKTFEMEHIGGAVQATLENEQGLLVTFEVLEPAECTGGPGTPAFTMGSDASNDFDIECPEVDPGDLTFEIRIAGVASQGALVVQDVLLDD